ncbi:MAG: serine/threonine phosphatase [Elainellaceae cyanobacterium]
MIICPECGFENPDQSMLCQNCGTDLQFNKAMGQGGPMPDESGLLVGEAQPNGDRRSPVEPTLRLAILFSLPDALPLQEVDGDCPAAKPLADLACRVNQPDAYLADRYQVQSAIAERGAGQAAPPDAPEDLEVMVVDVQPSESPFLEIALMEASSGESTDDLEALLATFPGLVRMHLLLQDELYPCCPQVQDAWSCDDYSALILENREQIPQLSQVANAAVGEQVLHWLYDMVQLWELLAPYGCHQSLLRPENLRVDEDQILCLKRLYQNVSGQTYGLANLGQLWRQVFSSFSERFSDLNKLFSALEIGEISTVNSLKQQLESMRINHDQESSGDQVFANPLLGNPMPNPLTDLQDPLSPSTETASESPFDDDGDDLPTVVLPMQLYSLSDAGYTDVGRMRKHNEDCFFIQTDIQKRETPSGRTCSAKGLYILCDGMGGHASGEVASSLAVEALHKSLQSWTSQLPMESSLNESIRLANQAIYEQNQQNDAQGNRRMGTTLVMLLVQGLEVAIAHVGDSRIYRVSRKFGLEQLTIDHEVGQREIHRGIDPEVAYSRQDAYQLTQALGPRNQEFIRPDIQYLPVTEDAVFILASDGLTDNELLERHYESHLEPLLSSQTNLDRGVADLIGLANQHNGHDNITAIAVRLKLRPVLQQDQ